ncbi:hypothetical protein HPULCUR_005999 [Helicostylum pulchrum]|uniref:Uncharacterized protein n=1 Tax=Helicostylum pulchrum TaxID=562976 RepID=A0ABP9Y0P0_9FUNG
MFFAVVFEAFAVFNLFTTLQAYLEPFRIEAGDVKEPAFQVGNALSYYNRYSRIPVSNLVTYDNGCVMLPTH